MSAAQAAADMPAKQTGIPGPIAWRWAQAQSQRWRCNMKTLITALALGTLLAAPAFVPSANARDASREQIIRDCMGLQNRSSNDGYEGRKGGGIQWQYRACMTEHGQPE